MEKFTVDLDAVLDEFEFNEGQANKPNVAVCPTVSGFFSPLSETGPSSLDLVTITRFSPERKNSAGQTQADIRYDMPCVTENQKVVGQGKIQDASNHCLVPKNPSECPKGLVDDMNSNLNNNNYYVEAELSDGHEKDIRYTDSLCDTLSKNPGDLCQTEDSMGKHIQCEAIKESKNDHHETSKLSDKFTIADPQTSTKIDTAYVGDAVEVSNPILLADAPEDDEEVHLSPMPSFTLLASPEKSLAEELEEEGLDQHCSNSNFAEVPDVLKQEGAAESCEPGSLLVQQSQHGAGREDYVDERQLEEYLRQLEMEKCEEKLIEENFPTEVEPAASALQSKTRTGAIPKQKPQDFSGLEELDPIIIADTSNMPGLAISEADLEPVIGTGSDSPPPYSEVDPMVDGIEQRPLRPHSLQLDENTPEDTGDMSDDTSVSLDNPVIGPPGQTPSNPTGPRLGSSNILDGLSEEQLLLGRVQPFWIPDTDTDICMICSARFTVVKRRHHCRACGKVLCSACCGEKYRLLYLDDRDGRVCTPCKAVLERLSKAEGEGVRPSATHSHRPNPANPMEYCTRVPVSEQVLGAAATSEPPSVMVPIGVLKRHPSTSEGSLSRQENKSVIFSDGIRPGGDLAELDGGSEHRTLGKRPGKGKPRRLKGKAVAQGTLGGVCTSKLPPEGLPMVSGKGKVEDDEISIWFSAGTCVNFVLNTNLTVLTKRVHYAPINKIVWNFASRGLTSVGQDEVVILLEAEEEEQLPPRDVYIAIQALYEQAGSGQPVVEMGHITVNSEHLGSNSHGGWLFIRHTFQAVNDLFLPPPPVLFGILLMRWEIPWARVFPLRLMLRLGAEYRYYPSPLVSTRNRKPVYGEVGHTIMNVLADFKNYAYTLPTIRGLVVHMSTGKTLILIPKNRHDAVCKALNNSNDPVLALGANFSMSVDSHLVAIQTEDGSYQTQAINIQNKERLMTGASFVVFNGALKSTLNLTAKSSIVEDGIMVQVLPDHMLSIRKSLQAMEDVEIGCGPAGAPHPDEVVSVKWVDEDKAFNIGIKSVIDGVPMDGVASLRIHSGPDIRTDKHILRWTEVFLISTPDSAPKDREPEPTRVAEGVARAVGVALLPHLERLKETGLSPLAVRVTLSPDNVSYEAGSGGAALPTEYMNNLDNELIPLIHSAVNISLVVELVFHLLDQ